MTDRKENSTNSLNEIYWKNNCGLSVTLSMIGGRWKINILAYLLNDQKLRYSQLKEKLVGISERILSSKLKELENDALIEKIEYEGFPPKVEYMLTKKGNSLKELIDLMNLWGDQLNDKQDIKL
ncbi:winged helix-turn-helix transcriptional regulator [Chryseobacterium pennipullorum]|uniref:Transcriptional regulator n=1 Tax=Chryseobacterium pennipullorum TaxID=2258963 RepID=A0A3D9ANF0_9FLAO|nr:helix-turn-helix domain-containing protein [Chryseobacterium pennipullorum]REC42685.1 transcriptional regulator [Chryseobacterium pennipullorum]